MSTSETKTDLETITEALDLSELPVEEQEKLLVDIQELVLKGTMARLVEQMDEKTRNEFSLLMDSDPTGDQVADFIEAHITDSDKIVQETIADFANDILAVTKE
jgi:5S rRNA maturation endonuclease (ribonuclease M5)